MKRRRKKERKTAITDEDRAGERRRGGRKKTKLFNALSGCVRSGQGVKSQVTGRTDALLEMRDEAKKRGGDRRGGEGGAHFKPKSGALLREPFPERVRPRMYVHAHACTHRAE